ncbi:fumarate hydratase [Oscillospiraceae bacterium MB08-C2-2]|nr:fumarate hydratase [Oscillospiraceae bacterium MB08-C2-2]
MREIHASDITAAVKALCIRANKELPRDIQQALHTACGRETHPLGQQVLSDLIGNYMLAGKEDIPICQDTGLAVIFLELGQEVHITGGSLYDAVNEGVRQGYLEGYLRLSVVSDPLRRVNTQDNTPAIIHTQIVPGDSLHITVAPKGAGSENMSTIRMFNPSAGVDAICAWIVDWVKTAGSNPCPPVIVGIGMGGSFEKCAQLAKKALCRPVGQSHPDALYAELESRLLGEINATGIGPQGFGGDTTALGVHIETFAAHIASLPVAVNMGCHVTRHASVTLK